jgi:Ca2+-binding RTX toxin-like protein
MGFGKLVYILQLCFDLSFIPYLTPLFCIAPTTQVPTPTTQNTQIPISSTNPGFFNLYIVALHEIGHALGFYIDGTGLPPTNPTAFAYGIQGNQFMGTKNLTSGALLDSNPFTGHFNRNINLGAGTSLPGDVNGTVVSTRVSPYITNNGITQKTSLMGKGIINGPITDSWGITDKDIKFLADVGYQITGTIAIPLTARTPTPTFSGYVIGGTIDNDTITGSSDIPGSLVIPGNDTLAGGPGNDTIYGMGGNDYVAGGEGNDSLFGDDSLGNLIGNDTIYGGNEDDTIYGMGGNDTLFGDKGNDSLFGDDSLGSLIIGNDSMIGGKGNDTYYVNSLDDVVVEKLNEGDDVVYVQKVPNSEDIFKYYKDNKVMLSIDKVYNYDGRQAATGGIDDNLTVANLELEANSFNAQNNLAAITTPGNWEIYSNRGADTITGGDGNDSLYGGAGNDTLLGGIGRDSLFGEAGNDRILGNAGNDALFGGAGNDTLIGGTGINNLQGFDINAPSATEVDTLIYSGTSITRFFLAAPDSNGIWTNGYKQGGNSDYALIQNYTQGSSVLGVANTFTTGRVRVGSDIWVYDNSNGSELIAIVQGITVPSNVTITTAAGISPLP